MTTLVATRLCGCIIAVRVTGYSAANDAEFVREMEGNGATVTTVAGCPRLRTCAGHADGAA